MKPNTYFSVAAYQLMTHRVNVLKLEATMNASATPGLFLQLHDAVQSPSDGAVPIKSWPASECGYKEFKNGELQLSAGLYVCLSTTAATKTAAGGGSDLIDILSIELTDPETPSGTSTVGTISGAGVSELEVWADADGPKKLIRVEVDNTAGAARYLMIFAGDSPTDGDAPIDQFTIAAGAVKTGVNALFFGESGRAVFSKDSSGVEHDGCTLKLSSTTGTLTSVVDTDTKIKAEYK